MKIILAGSEGLVGKALSNHFFNGHELIKLDDIGTRFIR